MGNNLRRVYIYPPLQQDDGVETDFWPPGATGLSHSPDDQFQSTSSDVPESYMGQGGGLLGMLLRGMQQQSQQQGAGLGPTPNAAPEPYPDSYGNPQGGLLSGLLALQAEQNRLFDGSDGQPPLEPANPDIRKLTRVYATGSHERAGGPFDRSNDQSNSSYYNAGYSNSRGLLSGSRYGDQAAPPIGAWQAASVPKPMVPGGASGISARPLVDTIPSRGLSSQTAAIASPHFNGPMTNAGPSAVGLGSREGSFSSVALANRMASPRGVAPLVPPPSAVPQMTGGMSRTYDGRPRLPWVPAAPAIQAAIEEIQAGRKRRRIIPPPTKFPGFLDAWLDAEAAGTLPYEGGGGRGSKPPSKKKGGGQGPCQDRFDEECDECRKRYYRLMNACTDHAENRRNLCNGNGGQPRPDEPDKWGPLHEEEYRNLWR